jgi:hypothetical protein
MREKISVKMTAGILGRLFLRSMRGTFVFKVGRVPDINRIAMSGSSYSRTSNTWMMSVLAQALYFGSFDKSNHSLKYFVGL